MARKPIALVCVTVLVDISNYVLAKLLFTFDFDRKLS